MKRTDASEVRHGSLSPLELLRRHVFHRITEIVGLACLPSAGAWLGGEAVAWPVLATLGALGVALWTHTFSLNDYGGLARFPAERLRFGLRADAALSGAPLAWVATMAALVALWISTIQGGRGVFITAGLLATSLAYSHPRLRGRERPRVSLLLHAGAGAGLFALGLAPAASGWTLVAGSSVWAAFLVAGSLVHQTIDSRADAEVGVRTFAAGSGRRLLPIAAATMTFGTAVAGVAALGGVLRAAPALALGSLAPLHVAALVFLLGRDRSATVDERIAAARRYRTLYRVGTALVLAVGCGVELCDSAAGAP